jgi:hypothetical protein
MLFASFNYSPPPPEIVYQAKVVGVALLVVPLVLGLIPMRIIWKGLLAGLITGAGWGWAASWSAGHGRGDMRGFNQFFDGVFFAGAGFLVGIVVAVAMSILVRSRRPQA